jgi:hypothetical protein
MLKFIRPHHGDEKVDKQKEGNGADDDGFHIFPFWLLN